MLKIANKIAQHSIVLWLRLCSYITIIIFVGPPKQLTHNTFVLYVVENISQVTILMTKEDGLSFQCTNFVDLYWLSNLFMT